jgi:hypothetical protein
MQLLEFCPAGGRRWMLDRGIHQSGRTQVGDDAILDRAPMSEQRIVEVEEHDRDHSTILTEFA